MPAKFVRSVSLTPELTAFIDAKIATGHNRSASEVVRAALRLLVEQDSRVEANHNQKNKNSPDGQDLINA